MSSEWSRKSGADAIEQVDGEPERLLHHHVRQADLGEAHRAWGRRSWAPAVTCRGSRP